MFHQDDITAAYVNFSRSSCLNERLLKEDKGVKRARPRLTVESRRDVVHLRRFGPKSCDELASRVADPDTGKVTLVPSLVLDDAVEIWREVKGARYNVQRRQRSDAGLKRGLKERSRQWYRQERLLRMKLLVEKAEDGTLEKSVASFRKLQFKANRHGLTTRQLQAATRYAKFQEQRSNQQVFFVKKNEVCCVCSDYQSDQGEVFA